MDDGNRYRTVSLTRITLIRGQMTEDTAAQPATEFDRINRRDWLALADRFYANLDRTFASLDAAAWRRTTPYLGWRARDVLAHMTSTMPLNFREVLGRALDGNPAPPAEFDTFRRNARAVAERRAWSVSQLLDEFHRELDAILATYRAMSDADWERPAWFFIGPVRVRTIFLVQFADNAFHERDLLIANTAWEGLDPAHGRALVDWFFREFRPATFRPGAFPGLCTTVWYHLTGSTGGDWTMTIADGRCRIEPGALETADLRFAGDAESVIAAGLARSAPWIGSVARRAARMIRPADAECFVAKVTGLASLATAIATRRIRLGGNTAVARQLHRAFWHFWERSAMTAKNIARG